MSKYNFVIVIEDIPMRLDQYLQQHLQDVSRSTIQKWIENGDVLVGGKTVAKNYKLKNKDIVDVTIPEAKEVNIEPQNIEINIVYQDDHLLVVNKPKGMVVHPAVGNYDNTLVNALLYHCKGSLSGINGEIRPGIVHRIDKNTSGLLVVAKDDQTHLGLSEQIKEHTFKREYQAVVYGNIKEESMTLDFPIGRHHTERKKMCVTEKGSREATTYLDVIKRYDGFTHLKLALKTGRTHQIRVHTAYIGHPVAGDDIYGVKKVITSLNGQCLHAKTIGFIHPITKQEMFFDSELPEYFNKFISTLKER